MPLKKNPNYSDFDPQENQRSGGYCSTFNFSMTRDQVEELSGLTQANFMESLDIIKQTIIDVIELHKVQDRELSDETSEDEEYSNEYHGSKDSPSTSFEEITIDITS